MSIDASDPSKGALPISDLEAFLSDMRNAPAWRIRSDMECDYYDGNQHTPEDIQRAKDRNLPVVTVNLVAPTIDLILGMEARTRTDWVVKSDGTSGSLTTAQADGLSAKLNDAERNSHADQACADAYASQIKAGIGWVEVARSSNPFDYRYRVQAVDRREIWWDMRGKDRLLSDARWLIRKKWNDLDAVLAMVPPEKHEFVRAAVSNPAGWDNFMFAQAFPYLQDDLISRDFWNDSSEWCDSERQRVCAYEVWYRTWHRGLVIKFDDGRVSEYDKKNPVHVASVGSGVAQIMWAAYQKMRLSWWVGPFRLIDMETPYGHNEFPYVPFFAKLEDATRTPYGLIRSMKSLQDEVNARRAKMMWQLSAQRVIAEDDAVDDHQAAAEEVNRPDAYIKLRAGRKQRGSQPPFQIEDHSGLNAQQFQVYNDAKQSVQQVAGVYAPMLGDAKSGADAGVAIDMLIEQGTTTLAAVNSNYKFSRTEVGRKLLFLLCEDMSGKKQTVKLPSQAASGMKSVTFNKQTTLADGSAYMENDVSQMLWKVALGDVPNNPTYNSQRMKDLVEFAKSLPPELQGLFADVVVMASDLPHKEQIAARIRQKLGMQQIIDPETATQEELAEAQREAAAQQQQAQIQQLAQQIELGQGAAKIAADTAKAQLAIANTELARATTGLTRMQTIEALLGANMQPTPAPSSSGPDGKPKAAAAPKKPEALDPGEVAAGAATAVELENPAHPVPNVSMGAGMSGVPM